MRTRTLSSTRETSQVERGHPGNFLINVMSKSLQEIVKSANPDDDPQQGPEHSDALFSAADLFQMSLTEMEHEDSTAFSRRCTAWPQ